MSQLDLQASQESSIWRDNPAFVHLLGISPLLALSDRSSTAFALGICTLLVGVTSALSCFAANKYLPKNLRYASFSLILAFFTSIVALIVELYFYPLWRELGVYLYLIAANFALMLKMDSYSKAEDLTKVLKDAFSLCLGLLVALVAFACIRELLLTGTILSDWRLLLPRSETLEPLSRQQTGELFQFSGLQPAAFILLGLVIAGLRQLNFIKHAKNELRNEGEIARERVTGRLKRKTESN